MHQNGVKEIQKSVTARYVLAISLIALLSTAAFLSLITALKDSDHTAFIVNISGKQRMLSQHIALDLHRLYAARLQQDSLQAHHLGNENTAYLQAAESLKLNLDEMLKANRILTTGVMNGEVKWTLSPQIHEMYFGQMNLYTRVENYIYIAKQSLQEPSTASAKLLLDALDVLAEPLLRDLNSVVQQYQLEGEERLLETKQLETFVWGATILALLLEVIFIFQPMVRRIVELTKLEQQNIENLKSIVELRTMNLEKTNQKLQDIAEKDPLTGLRNRLTLEKDIEQSLENYQKNYSPFALVVFDIDWFKAVNDDYGHDVGDYVIQKVGDVIQMHVRNDDRVYRAGGEEFVVLFNRIDLPEALLKAEQIRSAVEAFDFTVNEISLHKTISSGVYHAEYHQKKQVKDILKIADNGLYLSKNRGRNRVSIGVERTHFPKELSEQLAQVDVLLSGQVSNRVISIDGSVQSLLGYSVNEVMATPNGLLDMVYKKDWDVINNLSDQATEKGWRTTARFIDATGQVKILSLVAQKLPSDDIYLKMQDAVSLAAQVQDEMLLYNFHAMLKNSHDYIYFKDRNHVFTAASRTLVDVTNVSSAEELIGKTDYDVFDPTLADKYYRLEKQVFSGEVQVAQELQPVRDKNGHSAWVDNQKYPIIDERGEIIGLFGIARTVVDGSYANQSS